MTQITRLNAQSGYDPAVNQRQYSKDVTVNVLILVAIICMWKSQSFGRVGLWFRVEGGLVSLAVNAARNRDLYRQLFKIGAANSTSLSLPTAQVCSSARQICFVRPPRLCSDYKPKVVVSKLCSQRQIKCICTYLYIYIDTVISCNIIMILSLQTAHVCRCK